MLCLSDASHPSVPPGAHSHLSAFFPPLLTQSFSRLTVEGVSAKLNKNDHSVHATASTQLSMLECHSRRVLVARWVTLTNPVLSASSLYTFGLACASGRKWTRKCLGTGKGRVIKTIRDLGWRVSTPRTLWWTSRTSEPKISLHVSWGVRVEVELAII